MATTAHPQGARIRFGASAPSRTPVRVRLSARLRGPWLDRELAAGIAPWHSPAHTARSLQITSRRARRSLAEGLDGIQARAHCPATTRTAIVPVDRRAVCGAGPVLDAIAERLRGDAPVSAQGVAALRDAMSDGLSPFYNALSGDSLTRVLARIQASLDVPD